MASQCGDAGLGSDKLTLLVAPVFIFTYKYLHRYMVYMYVSRRLFLSSDPAMNGSTKSMNVPGRDRCQRLEPSGELAGLVRVFLLVTLCEYVVGWFLHCSLNIFCRQMDLPHLRVPSIEASIDLYIVPHTTMLSGSRTVCRHYLRGLCMKG